MATHGDVAHPEPEPDLTPAKMTPNSTIQGSVDTKQVASDLQAVNEQLLLTGLRDRAWTDQLRDQLAFTRAITKSLSEGVYTLDYEGQFTMVNPAVEQMLGWTEAELLGKQLDMAISIQSVRGVPMVWEQSHLWEVLHSGASYQDADAVMTRRDGTSFPATYSASPLLINDYVVGVVVSFRDMTEIQRLHHIQDAYVTLLAREHAVLEEQVQDRTSELAHTNTLLVAEINERKRIERARQHLLQQLVMSQEEERRRIALELHDQMGQSVTALMLAIKALHDDVGDARELQHHVATLHTRGIQLGQDVRTLAVQLRPPALDDFGLLPTLTTYTEKWSAQTLVTAGFYSTGLENIRLPELIEITIFRVVQEALTNITRHAQANTVSVILNMRGNTVHLIVEDDGVGFAVQLEHQRPHTERHFGLMGMEERVTHLEGTLTIESTIGSGTTVFMTLPLPRAT